MLLIRSKMRSSLTEMRKETIEMRICDVCNDPDPFKRQVAAATVEIHGLPGHREEMPKPDQYVDICMQCMTAKGLLELKKDPKNA